ncbi:MAG TPA: hypothetical protein DEQ09_02400 [Bacteroidales bacterium]|mgnify:CR=1 FL=1|nr:hypothetical protein [Bacteroidales bacterium]
MKLILAFITFIILTSNLKSQVYENAIYEHMEYLRRERIMSEYNPKAYENIGGTPYLNKEFEPGKVYLKSGEVFTGEYRFDLYANQIQFINEGSRYVISYPDKIYKVELNGHTFKYIDYKIDAGIRNGYFITLVEGYYSLYLKKSKRLKDPVPTKPYQQARPAKFLDYKDCYYIKIGDEPAIRVKNMKGIIKISGNLGLDVEDFIKREKIKLSREYDLVKLVNYINSRLLE